MACAVLIEDIQVLPQLAEWRLPKEVLLDILDRAAGERANVSASDPLNTGGMEMRRWCTRYLRDEDALKSLGWVTCAHNQVEGIRNDELKLKIVMLNTDSRTGIPSKEPMSVAEKGPAAEKLIKANESRLQMGLFDEQLESSSDPISEYEFLYFCVHASERYISAEVSRPVGMTAGFVSSYSKRVILVQPGEKPGLRRVDPVPEDFAEVEKPTLVRKA